MVLSVLVRVAGVEVVASGEQVRRFYILKVVGGLRAWQAQSRQWIHPWNRRGVRTEKGNVL